MVLAISRFRVTAGFRGSASDTVFRLPRLVDSTPGFLGMDAFFDSKDPAAFYVLTRWTDPGSFENWRASGPLRIPQEECGAGLQLEPDAEQLIPLEFGSADPLEGAEEYPAEAVGPMARHIVRSRTLHFLWLDGEGRVLVSNPAAEEVFGASASSPATKPIWHRLEDADAASLRGRLTEGDLRADEPLLLRVPRPDGLRLLLECRIERLPDGFLLFGEPVPGPDQQTRERLRQLENRLAAQSHEARRKGRALEAARVRLEETLAELHRALWHLRRVQEVLPVCMDCGRTKGEGTGLDELVDYLRRNELFLTHGYCAECRSRVLAECCAPPPAGAPPA